MNTLDQIPAGTSVRVSHFESHHEINFRLRELGFCENAVIRTIVNRASMLICEISNTRVGLHHSIANNIKVTSLQ